MVSSGFFDSKNHDRRYNCLQFGSLFDGIVYDGIFSKIGDCFRVKEAAQNGTSVIVSAGRAWFDHSWILNDAPELVPLEISDLLVDRIDAVVIETNWDEKVRNNTIKVIKGVGSSNPERPELVNSDMVHQYPLAYILVRRDSTKVRQEDITDMVGTTECPYAVLVENLYDVENKIGQVVDQVKEMIVQAKEDFKQEATEQLNQLVPITQAQYNAMGSGRPQRLYIIVG